MEAKSFNETEKTGIANPFDMEIAFGQPAIYCICSYEFATRKSLELQRVPWDMVVMDEAHKLRSYHIKSDGAKTTKVLDNALMGIKKVLFPPHHCRTACWSCMGLYLS